MYVLTTNSVETENERKDDEKEKKVISCDVLSSNCFISGTQWKQNNTCYDVYCCYVY